MANWRLAESLKKLREQINETYPTRSKASDGSIGDERHQASASSDHNPHVKDPSGQGIVTAIDITNDVNAGFDAKLLADALVESRDPRIKYIIFNRRMVSSYPAHGRPAWTWRNYTGANPHSKHIHISVQPERRLYDSREDWHTGAQASRAADIQQPGEAIAIAAKPEPPPAEPVSEKTVNIEGDSINIKTSEGAKPPETVLIEKPAPVGFVSKIKKQITGLLGGGITADVVTEKAAKAQALGLSGETWKRIFYFAVVAAAVYLAYMLVHHILEWKREKDLSKELIAANTTPSNTVMLVSKAEAAELASAKDSTVKVVTR